MSLALFCALVVAFLKMPNPNIPFWTWGWTTTMNIYAQVGLVTLVGGMTIGTIFTLFMVPAIYVPFAMDHARERSKAMDRRTGAAMAVAEPLAK